MGESNSSGWRRRGAVFGTCLSIGLLAAPANAMNVKWDAESARPWTWRWLMDILVGVEVGGTLGTAHLRSTVRQESGDRLNIANGNVSQTAFHFSLLGVPRETGFAVAPSFGFFSEQLDVADFYAALPTQTAGTEVAGTCSDPTTGELLDCNDPNVYTVRMTSIFLGAKLAGNFVVEWGPVELFASASAGGNAAEYRTIDAAVARGENRRSGFAFGRSVVAGASTGLLIPRWHVGLRLAVDYVHYFRFKYGEPLEFRGPVTYDDDRNAFIKPRMWVVDAAVDSILVTAAVGYLF